MSRIFGTHQSSSHDVEKPKDRRKSGLMVALAFDDDAKHAELPEKELQLCPSSSSSIRGGGGRDLCVMESSR